MGEHGLGLFQPPADLNGIVQDDALRLVLESADFQRHRFHSARRRRNFYNSGRTADPKVLTEELALSYFPFIHAAAPFFFRGNFGLPSLSRLLPFASQSSQASKNSR